MVIRLFAILCLGGWTVSAPAASLALTLDRPQVARGSAVRAEIHARGFTAPLSQLDLSPLLEDFRIEQLGLEQATDGPAILRLRLHPRRNGKLRLPALHFQGVASRPVNLRVVPDKVHGQPVAIEYHLSAKRVWQRQQVRVQVEVFTADEFASLRTALPRLPGFEAVRLPARRETVERDGERWTRLRTGWILHPLIAGHYRLELPPIAYRVGGGVQWRWSLPRLRLAVRPLPDWLPPTITVGTLHIDSRLEAASPMLQTGELGIWRITLRSPDIPPAWFPPVLRQLRSNAAIRFFPAASERRQTPNRDGIHGEVTYRIPFKPLRSGRLALPTLRIPRFDPETGRLQVLRHPPSRPLALGLPWRLFLAGILLLAVWHGLPPLGRTLQSRWRRHRLRRTALADIMAADDPWQLRRALAHYARAMGWPTNLTLNAWLHRWQARHITTTTFERALQQLVTACYGNGPAPDMATLRHALLTDLQSPRRRPRLRSRNTAATDPFVESC